MLKGKYGQLEYEGEPLAQLCRRTGISYQKVYRLMKAGNTIQEAIKIASNHMISSTPITNKNIAPCKYCKQRNVKIIAVGDALDRVYYAQCQCCSKWSPYEFVGINSTRAIQQWNYWNRPQGKTNNI